MAQVRVYVTCDADQDGSTGVAPERSRPRWEGIGLLPAAALELAVLGLPFTVFVRADHQVRDLFGSALAVYRRVETLLAGSGAEIGWHPHLYLREGDRYFPVRDGAVAARLLDELSSEIVPVPGLSCVRLGEAWHSNATMGRLAALGYRVDSTALPGRRRSDATLEFDWEPTPNRPYHPSAADYRVPGEADALPILEVPMTTCAVRADYDSAPVRRYLNLVFHERPFAAAVDDYLLSIRDADRAALVPIFHTGELLPLAANGLYAYGLSPLRRNLSHLIFALAAAGHVATFHHLHEAVA